MKEAETKVEQEKVEQEKESPRVRGLSSRELQGVVRGVKDAILRGTAQLEDYEDFVLCQQELERRAHPR